MMKILKPLLVLLAFLWLLTDTAAGQSLYSARSVGTGGGGVSYLSGYSAAFLNPANLLIHDHRGTVDIGLLQTGLFLNSKPIDNQKQFAFLHDQFSPSGIPYITSVNVGQVLNKWFPGNNQTYSRNAEYDMILLGISWRQKERAFSFAVRSRAINTIAMTRGWFDPSFESTAGSSVLKRNLQQTIADFNEISFGYAQELNIISGWTPQLSRFYFGIAPKLILPGMFFKGDYQSEYFTSNQTGIFHHYLFSHNITTGGISDATNNYNSSSSNAGTSLNGNELYRPSGWGIGLDAGLTYIISLGNDISLLNRTSGSLIKKSLRFSLSITDIGFIDYRSNVKTYQYPPDTLNVNNIPDVTGHPFTASPGSFSHFVSADDSQGKAFGPSGTTWLHYLDEPLPVALHAGSEFQWNWIMLAGDVRFNLNHASFNTGDVVFHLGSEIRIIPHVPIRAGIQLENHYPGIFAVGTGLDTRYFEINASAMINTPGIRHNTYGIAAAVAAIHLHL